MQLQIRYNMGESSDECAIHTIDARGSCSKVVQITPEQQEKYGFRALLEELLIAQNEIEPKT